MIVAAYLFVGFVLLAVMSYLGVYDDDDPFLFVAIALLTVPFWPVVLIGAGSAWLRELGARNREKAKDRQIEQRRQLAIGEAALNRDGFYGDRVQANQIMYDERGSGLYRHELTAEEAR